MSFSISRSSSMYESNNHHVKNEPRKDQVEEETNPSSNKIQRSTSQHFQGSRILAKREIRPNCLQSKMNILKRKKALYT